MLLVLLLCLTVFWGLWELYRWALKQQEGEMKKREVLEILDAIEKGFTKIGPAHSPNLYQLAAFRWRTMRDEILVNALFSDKTPPERPLTSGKLPTNPIIAWDQKTYFDPLTRSWHEVPKDKVYNSATRTWDDVGKSSNSSSKASPQKLPAPAKTPSSTVQSTDHGAKSASGTAVQGPAKENPVPQEVDEVIIEQAED